MTISRYIKLKMFRLTKLKDLGQNFSERSRMLSSFETNNQSGQWAYWKQELTLAIRHFGELQSPYESA